MWRIASLSDHKNTVRPENKDKTKSNILQQLKSPLETGNSKYDWLIAGEMNEMSAGTDIWNGSPVKYI